MVMAWKTPDMILETQEADRHPQLRRQCAVEEIHLRIN